MTRTLPKTPDGWILGTDCGYKSHAGFVKDAGRDNHWSLTPIDNSPDLWCLAFVQGRIAVTNHTMSLESALEYVK